MEAPIALAGDATKANARANFPIAGWRTWIDVKNSDFQAFIDEERTPLLVSFLHYARELGFPSQVSFDFFDAYVFDPNQADFDPVVAVKQVKNSISKEQMGRLVVDETPTKVILVEGGRPDRDNLLSTHLTLAMTGCGVFVRGSGWAYLPRRASMDDLRDVRFKLAPRWEERDGVWKKKCAVCGEWKGENEYYKRPADQKTSRDPYRNACVTCFRAKRNSTRA
jgi:hypothetical protein